MAGTMALASLGVMRMVLAPAAIRFSMAVTWPALSPSVLPAADTSLAPSFLASAVAPSFIFTKKGLVSVLVMRPMTGSDVCAWARPQARAPVRARAESAKAGVRCMVLSPGVGMADSCRPRAARLAGEPLLSGGWDRTIVADELINQVDLLMVFPIQSADSSPAHTAPPLRVATAGEALFDLIEEPDGRLKPCAGGAVYNLTRALGLQGVGTQYLNPLSGDLLGRQLARGLHEAGVALAAPAPVRAPSALALAALDAAGKASYSFYRDGVADRQVTAAALIAACAALPDLLVVATCCQALAVPGVNALERARYLQLQTQAQWLALTLGPEGAWLLQRDGLAVHAREEAPITVVDTVGAGDCFLAGLITAWLAGPERGEEARARGAEGLTPPVTEARLRAMLLHALASACHCVERAQRADIPYSAGLAAGLRARLRGRVAGALAGVAPSASAAEASGAAVEDSALTSLPPARALRARGVAALRGLAPGFAPSPLRARLRRGVAASGPSSSVDAPPSGVSAPSSTSERISCSGVESITGSGGAASGATDWLK